MRQVQVARGNEGDCYKCGHKIKPGQFIIFKPVYGRAGNKTAVHDTCSPMRVKKHGAKVKKRG